MVGCDPDVLTDREASTLPALREHTSSSLYPMTASVALPGAKARLHTESSLSATAGAGFSCQLPGAQRRQRPTVPPAANHRPSEEKAIACTNSKGSSGPRTRTS